MEQVIKYLLTSSDEEIGHVTLRDVSKALGIPFLILEVVFLLTRRETFTGFVEREKLHRAARHLEEDRNINIAELSKSLGFATQEEFTDRFDKFYLVEPGRYWELAQIKKYSLGN